MKYRLAVAVAAAAMLAGCNTLPKEATDHGSVVKTTEKKDGAKETIENLSDYAAYTKAKAELAGKEEGKKARREGDDKNPPRLGGVQEGKSRARGKPLLRPPVPRRWLPLREPQGE